MGGDGDGRPGMKGAPRMSCFTLRASFLHQRMQVGSQATPSTGLGQAAWGEGHQDQSHAQGGGLARRA